MNTIKKFDFYLPTKIRFGNGISKELGQEIHNLGKIKPMIITDKGIINTGLIKKIIKDMKLYNINRYLVFDQVEPNPRDITVQKAYELAKQNNIDILIAIGGGSSIDTAKAIGVLLSNGGVISNYEGLDNIKNPIIDLIAIPTTVGTGSEVTFWSVITDTQRHFKMSIGTPLIAPKIALVDPDLVNTLPSSIIASTGMDALTHAIEGYTCTLAEPITDSCGIYAIKLISENIRAAALENSPGAKANMLLGSLIAGICFGNSDIAAVHCMAEALGGLYDTPHGIANAIILPYVMEYNFTSNIDKFSEIAKSMGAFVDGLTKRDTAYQSVLAVKKLNADLKMPSLREIGVKESDLQELAERSSRNVSINSNPRIINKKDFLKLFEEAYY